MTWVLSLLSLVHLGSWEDLQWPLLSCKWSHLNDLRFLRDGSLLDEQQSAVIGSLASHLSTGPMVWNAASKTSFRTSQKALGRESMEHARLSLLQPAARTTAWRLPYDDL